MEKKGVGLVFAVLVAAVFLSCGTRNAYVDVLKGNYYFGRGMYQSAVVEYLNALEDVEHKDWIKYNLGNVYFSLGETDAAAEIWANASESRDPVLLFNIAFNKGTLLYELGKYREAFEEFKKALQLDSTHLGAKINLELSLRKMGTGAGLLPPVRDKGKIDRKREDPERILDYIKKKETTRWTASNQIDSDSEGDDW
jgi:tetratricopeptide (TPR) repeat protein